MNHWNERRKCLCFDWLPNYLSAKSLYLYELCISEECVKPQLRKLAVSKFQNEKWENENVGNIMLPESANKMFGPFITLRSQTNNSNKRLASSGIHGRATVHRSVLNLESASVRLRMLPTNPLNQMVEWSVMIHRKLALDLGANVQHLASRQTNLSCYINY